MADRLDAHAMLGALKAAGEPTRLRILRLLARGEMTVKDLTHVLAQSQPRISRHLKLLNEAGFLDRHREGSWVYFRLSDRSEAGRLARQILEAMTDDDAVSRRDQDNAGKLVAARAQVAQDFFAAHAADWDRLRSLHVEEGEVEALMRAVLGDGQIESLVDLGTGTGRMLELFSDMYHHGLGVDANQSMLACARANLDRIGGGKAHVRQGDITNLALDDASADVVVMHQVLHFISDPARAIGEAARLLRPGGRLLIVDFAPHELEFLREQFAHERLGFSNRQIEGWLSEYGLEATEHREMAPRNGPAAEKLTVSLWLAYRRPSQHDTASAGGAAVLEPVH